MSIHKIQQFHLTTVYFWPKTLFFRTQQVRNSMTQLTLIHIHILLTCSVQLVITILIQHFYASQNLSDKRLIGNTYIFKGKGKCQFPKTSIKVQNFWKGQKPLKISHLFWRYWVNVKTFKCGLLLSLTTNNIYFSLTNVNKNNQQALIFLIKRPK